MNKLTLFIVISALFESSCLRTNREISGRYYRSNKRNEYFDINFETNTFKYSIVLKDCTLLDSGFFDYNKDRTHLYFNLNYWNVDSVTCDFVPVKTLLDFRLRKGVLDLAESRNSYILEGHEY